MAQHPLSMQRRILSISFYKHIPVYNRMVNGCAAEELRGTSLQDFLGSDKTDPAALTLQLTPQDTMFPPK